MISAVDDVRWPVLLHVCGRYLPLSETFTYDLIRGLDGFAHHVLASSLEHLDLFPLPSVHAPHPESDAWALARSWGIDAVVCHFGPQCTMGMPIAAMLGVPIVTVFHGYDISRLLQDRRWVERYRACFAQGMFGLCISEAGRRKLMDVGCPGERIEVIHLGVDPARFEYRPPSTRWAVGRPVRLLMVARLVPKKGVSVALDALAALTARGVACELRIVGDGPLREELHDRAVALGLSNVRWMGALPHAQAQLAFDWADIYIQPSLTATNGDEEGIPVSLMEALASGLPAVSTRHSGIPELIEHGQTGLLIDEADATGLADSLATLTSDRALAERLARAGRQWVEQEFDQYCQTMRFGAWMATVVARGTRARTPDAATPARTERGLIVQSSVETGLLARKLTLLAHRHPGVTFDILSDDVAALDLERLPGIGEVVRAPGGRARLLPTDLRRRLERSRYRLVVVPFTDETGRDQQWARDLSSSLHPERIVYLTHRDREIVPAVALSS